MPIYRFSHVLLDTSRHRLTVGGHATPAQPLIFDLLHFFARNPNKLLTKEELLEGVWRTTFVTDSVIARAVMKARRLIADESTEEPLITTVRGVGYRFDAEVDVLDDAPAHAVKTGPTNRGSAPIQPAGGVRLSLAILPFVNEKADAELSWAERGLAGLVHHQLETRGRLSLASINATGDWHGVVAWSGETLALACEQLGTERALLCQFARSSAGDYRVEALLGNSEDTLERREFLGPDLVGLASTVVSFVDALALPSPEPIPPFWEEQLARAFDCELRGELAAALPLLESCLEQLDVTPRMRLVHARLLREQSADMDRARDTARQALEQAQQSNQHDLQVDIYAELCRIEVNSGDLMTASKHVDQGMSLVFSGKASAAVLANILIARADMERFQGQPVLAAKTAARAVEAARSVGDVYREQLAACLHAHVLMAVPRMPKAIELLRSVVRETRLRGLTRVELQGYQSLGTALGFARQYTDAVEATRRAALLSTALGFKGKFVGSRIQEAFILVDAGRLPEAEACVRECQALMEHEAPIYLTSALARARAHLLWRQGQCNDAVHQMAEMLVLAQHWGWYTRWLCASQLCGWYLSLGRYAEAQQAFEVLRDDTNAARRARCEAALLLYGGQLDKAKACLRSTWTTEPSDGAAGQDLTVDLGWMLLEQGLLEELQLLMRAVSRMSKEHLPTALLQCAHDACLARQNGRLTNTPTAWRDLITRLPALQRNAVAWAQDDGLERLLTGQFRPGKLLLSHACD